MRFWGRRAEPAAPEQQQAPAPAAMDEATAAAVIGRFRLALANPAAVIGRAEAVDRAALHDAPARIEAAILLSARAAARSGDAAGTSALRSLARSLAAVAAPEVAAQLRAFHAKLPSGEDATMTGITIRIEEAISTTDFVTHAARVAGETRRLTAALEAALATGRREARSAPA